MAAFFRVFLDDATQHESERHSGVSAARAVWRQGVADHRNAAQAHGGRRQHRVQQTAQAHEWHQYAGGDRDADCVIGKGEEQVLFDLEE